MSSVNIRSLSKTALEKIGALYDREIKPLAHHYW